ncbi:unnamed protein product [Trichobilharzia regenti]|nr:unnamed protein product [Trichobilharzia regenti]
MEYAEKYLSDDSNVGYELKEVPVARIETATIATTNTTTTNTTASINSNRVILNPTNNLAGLSEAIVDIEHVLYKNCIELNQHEEKLVALLERSEAMEKSYFGMLILYYEMHLFGDKFKSIFDIYSDSARLTESIIATSIVFAAKTDAEEYWKVSYTQLMLNNSAGCIFKFSWYKILPTA